MFFKIGFRESKNLLRKFFFSTGFLKVKYKSAINIIWQDLHLTNQSKLVKVVLHIPGYEHPWIIRY